MNDQSPNRKRQHARVPSHEPARLYFSGDQASVAGCLINLSIGGAYIRCTTPVEVGRKLTCAFFLDYKGKKQLVGCKGEVRWIASERVRKEMGPGFGISFETQRPAFATIIKSFINQQHSIAV